MKLKNKADIFVSVTAVPNVYINYGTKEQQALTKITAKELLELSNKYLHEDSMYEIVVG